MAVFLVVHAYEAQHTDEMSLQVGQSILVLEKPEGGWWRGHLRKDPENQGWFPSSHVKPSITSPTTVQMSEGAGAYRGFMLQQLIDRERGLSEKLAGIKHRFLDPLFEAEWLSKADKELLLAPLHESVELQQRLFHPIAAALQLSYANAVVGDLLLDLAPAFLLNLTTLASRTVAASERIRELEASSSEFSDFLKQHATPPSLEEALSLPITGMEQRILIISELSKRTAASHADSEPTKLAATCYEQLFQSVVAVKQTKAAEASLQTADIDPWFGPPIKQLGRLRLTSKVELLTHASTAEDDERFVPNALIIVFESQLVLLVQSEQQHQFRHHRLAANQALSDTSVSVAGTSSSIVTLGPSVSRASVLLDEMVFHVKFADKAAAISFVEAILRIKAADVSMTSVESERLDLADILVTALSGSRSDDPAQNVAGHTHAGEHVGEFDVISNYSRTSGAAPSIAIARPRAPTMFKQKTKQSKSSAKTKDLDEVATLRAEVEQLRLLVAGKGKK